MNIQKAIIQFLREVGGTKAANTQRSYSNGINVLKAYFKKEGLLPTSPLTAVSVNILVGYPAYMGRMKYSKKTIALYIASVRAFFNWLIIGGHLDPSPREMLRFEMAYKNAVGRKDNRLPRWPKKDDVEKMCAAVRVMKVPSPRIERNVAMIELLASTGCRNSEVCELRIDDIDIENRSAIVTGKGDKERQVFFSTVATRALLNYWSTRPNFGPKAFVFCRHDKGAGKKMKKITTATVRNIINDAAMIAGIDNFTPHYFRHAFAIKMLRETGNLALVQDLMGHADPAATRIYAKIYPDDLRDMHHEVYV